VSAKSPTILVVSGVVGLGAAAVMAARATRKIDPVIESHQKERWDIKAHMPATQVEKKEQQRKLFDLYMNTGWELGKIYGPTILVGSLSAVSVLYGHRILQRRHAASLAAYSSLFELFTSYRKRVAQTVGEEKERAIYDGATLQYVEDPDHKGEYKLEPKFPDEAEVTYLRPWFGPDNPNWVNDPISTFSFLKGVQQHMNNVLNTRGYVFLNDVLDALRLPQVKQGQVAGWLLKDVGEGDGFIDFGLYSDDPHTVAFRDGMSKTVQLHFNIDGNIYDLL